MFPADSPVGWNPLSSQAVWKEISQLSLSKAEEEVTYLLPEIAESRFKDDNQMSNKSPY